MVLLPHPESLQAFCEGQRVPRLTAMENILTSFKDGNPKPSSQSFARLTAAAKAQTGVVATWNGAQLIMPQDARAFGESDQYVRIRRAVFANVSEDAPPPRPVDVEVRDHGVYKWYTFTAYDTQNVCVEGRRAM
ncbi:MAG TPA: hypothetical protein VN603_05410 [Candidatus Acidoferrales bacterium]|nr:hypothetical protein [Candidatus Acidoferrales bacterium]